MITEKPVVPKQSNYCQFSIILQKSSLMLTRFPHC